MASITRRAALGPTPSSMVRMRNQLNSSQGFSSTRRNASMSLMWAASMKRSPPYLWKGIFRRASSISSELLWLPARKSTAWRCSGMFAARCSRIRMQTSSSCSASLWHVTKTGFSPSPRVVRRFLVKRSAAWLMTALEASRMGCSER